MVTVKGFRYHKSKNFLFCQRKKIKFKSMGGAFYWFFVYRACQQKTGCRLGNDAEIKLSQEGNVNLHPVKKFLTCICL